MSEPSADYREDHSPGGRCDFCDAMNRYFDEYDYEAEAAKEAAAVAGHPTGQEAGA